MKRILSAAAVISMFAAVGCSASMTTPQTADAAQSDAAPKTEATKGATESASEDAADKAADASKADAKSDAADLKAADAKTDAPAEKAAEAKVAVAPWATGDFVVYRFSGSFLKAPVTLTEKVVARQGDAFTLDVTFDDGTAKESIRAHMKGDSPMHGDVVSVGRMVKGVEKAAPLALYDEVLGRVALVADQNEAQLGTEKVKLAVAGHGTIACERATYRVKVGKQTATMRTTESDAFAWGEVGAEITGANGKVIYKAEIVDAGHESHKQPAIASADDDY
ncbi:MAG: hypothetical protein U0441_30930 [Polyangiaceae bacterium]